jgi:hypothetical protein
LPGAHVGGREDARVGVDLDLLAAADPGLERAVGELAPIRGAPVGELVHAVVQTDEHGGPGAVQRDECGDLVAAGGADEAIRAGAGLLGPDADHGADGPVVVHDGRAVQGVPAHGEPPVGVAGLHLGLLLGRAPRDHRGGLHGVPHDLVGNDVHGELRVAEGVGGALDGDERGAERLGDVRAGVELLLDHGLDLGVRALGVEHGVEGIVRFLLLRGGVEGGAGGAVGVAVRHAHVALERARRLDGGARGAAGRGGRADRDGGHGEGLFVQVEALRFERR